MVTREQIEYAFDEERETSFGSEKIDYQLRALNLLREKIPYEKCPRIIQAGGHEMIYLVDIEDAMPYLDEQDLRKLNDCNVGVDEDTDSFYMFV